MGGQSQGGGGGTEIPSLDCRDVDEFVVLVSPNPPVLEDVSKEDTLSIDIYGDSVVAMTENGDVVGAISETWTDDLIDCIEQGYSYIADVKSIDGGTCRVNLRNINT